MTAIASPPEQRLVASPARRRLLTALAATLAASGWLAMADDGETPVVAPAPRATARAPAIEVAARATVPVDAWPAPPRNRPAAEMPADASAWASPRPPPQPASAPPPAAKAFVGPVVPQAPPFRYTLIGRLDDGQLHALLTDELRSIDVRVGELIDGQWRLDSVGSDGIVVTWLPAGKRQQIGFKSS